VGWSEDAALRDDALLDIAAGLGWTSEDARAHLPLLRSALAAPAIADLLSRRATARRAATDDIELRREWPLVALEGEALLLARIDRLVLGRRAGSVVWAEIIDFKTDAPGQAQGAAARHAEQMDSYRRAVCRALRLGPEQVEVALAMLRDGAVVRC
jgi:hypothetical protein